MQMIIKAFKNFINKYYDANADYSKTDDELFQKFIDKWYIINANYNKKEKELFSKSFIGYWVTQSKLSKFLRVIFLSLWLISGFVLSVCIVFGYDSQLALCIYEPIFLIAGSIFVTYFIVAIVLSIRYANQLIRIDVVNKKIDEVKAIGKSDEVVVKKSNKRR